MPDEEEYSPVAQEYSQLLSQIAKQHGLDRKDLVTDGLSKNVVWRILGHTDRPTLKGALSVARRLKELLPGVVIPPPAVAVRSSEHYDWCVFGELLQNHDYELFLQLLTEARGVAAPLAEAKKNKEEALARLRQRSGRPSSDH